MSKSYFVTGTDTDVGKTYVSCGLLEAAKLAGFSTAAVKPLAAGSINTEAGPRNEDALALQKQCSLNLTYSEINPVLFDLAIAPHIAAVQTEQRITVKQLGQYCQRVIKQGADFTMIEGAGGWKVPLNENELLSALVKELRLPVILVVAMRLGCINHALLTAQAIEFDGLTIAGWVANQAEPKMQAYDENVETLARLIPAPLLAEVQYDENFSVSSSCASQFELSLLLQ